MAETTRPIEEEFAVVVAALLAGRIDGQQAVQSLAALHRRLALSWLGSVLADDATVDVLVSVGIHEHFGVLDNWEWSALARVQLAALSAHLAAPGPAGDPNGEVAGRG